MSSVPRVLPFVLFALLSRPVQASGMVGNPVTLREQTGAGPMNAPDAHPRPAVRPSTPDLIRWIGAAMGAPEDLVAQLCAWAR